MTLSLASVYRRCTEDGGCLIWQGARTGNDHPTIYLDGKHRLLKRIIFESVHGVIPKGRVIVGAIGECKCPTGCVNDAHLQAWRRSKLATVANRNRKSSYTAGVQGRLPTAKLDFAKAREIRQMPGPAWVAAKQHNVSPSLIVQIRRGEIWRESAPNSSIFTIAQGAR